ncbi:MAG TPA: hypothetical protein VD908_10640, partial [Cytophagales bacterium]|nr:hypothetical protein [Cytophagales bacterium]
MIKFLVTTHHSLKELRSQAPQLSFRLVSLKKEGDFAIYNFITNATFLLFIKFLNLFQVSLPLL